MNSFLHIRIDLLPGNHLKSILSGVRRVGISSEELKQKIILDGISSST